MKRKLLISCVLLASCGCSHTIKCDQPSATELCSRILFLGNSYTFENDLPAMFAELAYAGGFRIETGTAAQAGWTLSDHVNSSATLDMITSSKWDFVVLQEQSQIPAIEPSRTDEMYPAARLLVRKIKATGATPIFFLTWAHRDGWPEVGLPDYQSMQFQIDIGYLGIARELNAPLAPVGYVWLLASGQNPQLDLWQVDGSHPTEQGTYLAACVFYALIFRQSPAGLPFLSHLPEETALFLQQIAADTVLNNPHEWNLP